MGIGEVFLVLMMLGLCSGVLALGVTHERKQYEARARAWKAYAAARGLVFVPREGSWLRPGTCRIAGTVEQIALEVDTFLVQRNKSATVYTRVVARAIDPMACNVRVSTAHFFSDLGRFLGLQDLPTGDAAFDETFVVKADRDQDARALLDAPTRKALRDFPRSLRFEYRAGEVELHWLGFEADAAVLDAASRIVVAACRWRREPALYR